MMKFEYLDAKSSFMKTVISSDIDYIKQHLYANEELVGLSVGVFQHDYGLYALTDDRLIFCSTANGRNIFKEYQLKDVRDVHLSHTGLYNIRLSYGNTSYRLGIAWQAAREFYKLVDEVVSVAHKAA